MNIDERLEDIRIRLDRLSSIEEIRSLALRYAYAVDSRDWPLMESLWIETSARHGASIFDGGTMLDIHVMREIGARFSASGPSTLLVANHFIDFDDVDHARGSVYCHCQMERSGTFFEQMILYQDIYERNAGRWLFRSRDHLLWWGSERSDDPTRQAPAFWPASQIGAGVAFERICRS